MSSLNVFCPLNTLLKLIVPVPPRCPFFTGVFDCCLSLLSTLTWTSDQDSALLLLRHCLHVADLLLFLTRILPMIWCLLAQLLLYKPCDPTPLMTELSILTVYLCSSDTSTLKF